MKELTEKQRRIFEFILAEAREKGLPPTLDEIRRRFRLRAIGTVQDHLRALIGKGWLTRGRGARSLRVAASASRLPESAPPPARSALVPVLGDVAAGRPLLAVEHVEDSWLIDRSLLRGDGNFFLKVKGDSMIGAQIREGDYVLVRPQPAAEPGEIVVIRFEDEVTVKRLGRRRGGIELVSENPIYPPIPVSPRAADFELIGKVVGVLRRF